MNGSEVISLRSCALRSKAFTLIELLVVISVIALLMAIIMPALRKAKEKARLIVCASNQKQLILGLTLYADSNATKLPPHPSKQAQHKGGYHRPYELNWRNNFVGTINDTADKDYHYAGRYLSAYLPDVKVFNCPLSAIREDTPWPPPTSDQNPVGTYGDFYRTGRFTPLHSTYMLLWSYQGYNHKESRAVDKNQGHFEGPKTVADKTKLVVQDSFFYLTSNKNVLWLNPQVSWYSCHNFRGSIRAYPYYVLKDPTRSEWPMIRLNAAYLDGRVEGFNSPDAIGVKNYNAQAYLAPKFR